MRSEKTGRSKAILEAIYALPRQDAVLMEVCGTHTMAIAKAGIKSLLPEGVRLVSGPGCPVCVTPAEVIDAALALSMDKKILIATYGDMIRVPGSAPGDSLQRRRGLGAEIKIVYSPVDAVELARERPDREVVFLGVGFETTAPGTAAAVLMAKEAGVNNFSLWSMLKTVEPALRALIGTEGFHVQGFLCPGHVASIIGERGFAFLPRDFGIPAVISGFLSRASSRRLPTRSAEQWEGRRYSWTAGASLTAARAAVQEMTPSSMAARPQAAAPI